MKPNTLFVSIVLAMFNATRVDDITREQILLRNGDILRTMNAQFTPGAQKLLADLCGEADEKDKAILMSLSTDKTSELFDSGLLQATEDERKLICRIYGTNGRELEILEDTIIVSPLKSIKRQRKLAVV